MSRDFGIFMPKHLAGQWCVNSNRMSALIYKKGHLKNQVPHCIIYLEDDRKRVPVALGIINE